MNANSRQIMSFGEDPHIDVAYSVPPGHVGNGLILRDRLERRQTVTLTNHGKTARNVRLYARLPLSTQPDVSVEAKFAPKPDAENVDNVKGIVLWEKNLAHGDSLRVETATTSIIPKGKNLSALSEAVLPKPYRPDDGRQTQNVPKNCPLLRLHGRELGWGGVYPQDEVRNHAVTALGRVSVLSRLALHKKMVGVIPTLVKVHHFSP